MRRVFPLLAFALVPMVVAAPVPPDAGRPAFGAGGLLARAELEKVKFDSRAARDSERLAALPGAPKAPGKGLDQAAIAVHLPWHTFREGEPVPAYFVFRNGSDRAVSLDGRLDLFGPRPCAWMSCALGVFRAKTGESVLQFEGRDFANGSERMFVPSGGFYCVRYDVGRTSGGAALPPGEYEVEWRCAGLYSAPARFTVTRGAGANPEPHAPRERVHFFALAPEPDKERRPVKAGGPFVWESCRVTRVFAGDVFAALATGQCGVYAPDLYAVPDADQLLKASVEWKPDRAVVTLVARDPKKPVRFAERPHLYVHFRATDDGDLPDPAELVADDKPRAEALTAPVTIEARLPRGWLEKTGVHRSARVAVLVTSTALELPLDVAKVRKNEDRRTGAVWEGVLLTPFSEPRFEQPPPADKP